MGDDSQKSDFEQVEQWATQMKISPDAVKLLFKDGFTSMEAVTLLDRDDLAFTKIPRGQQKLILKAVAQLRPGQEESGGSQQSVQPSNMSAVGSPPAERETRQQGSSTTETRTDHGLGDDYIRGVLQHMANAQNSQSANFVSAAPVVPVAADRGLGAGVASGTSNMAAPSVGSWQDPQLHLQNAAGKMNTNYHDITDFVHVAGATSEQIVLDTPDGPQLVLRSGNKKPKLEHVSIQQWSVANLAILHTLVTEMNFGVSEILDYLSHTTRVYQLLQNFQHSSVFFFDREYRRAQANQHFRWGTEMPHLQICFLQGKFKQAPSSNLNNRGNQAPRAQGRDSGPKKGPVTKDGLEICKNFNATKGCHYSDCRFLHVCSVPKCEQKHSAQVHESIKN